MASILDRLAGFGIIPVVVIDDATQAEHLADALVKGGLPVAEITFRTAAAPAAIKALSSRGDMLVGAGTVTTADQVDAAISAGAQYIVSPGTSRAVVERALAQGVQAIPGAVTATEIQAALELGYTTVKFFPAGVSGGPAAISALAAPFSGVRFIPTGGITPDNLADYMRMPSVVAVGGSWMVKPEFIRSGNFGRVYQLTIDAVAQVTAIRASR